jgi:electron transport complex protein RnfG
VIAPALRHTLQSAVLLAMFALAGASLVAITHQVTKDRIARNEREALLWELQQLVPPGRYDNDLLDDTLRVTDVRRLGTAQPVTVYRARKDGKPVAAILTPVAPDGYGGPIHLLVAVNYDGTLAGVRVTSHNETPGLGDAIEEKRSDWILGFTGRSLGNPPEKLWRVKRDGGVFDQFTGATITPRAVVNAVRKTLEYFASNRDELFASAPAGETSP